MPNTQIGPALLIALGLVFAIYGLVQLVQAYRLELLDEWVAMVVPGAGAVVLGALLTWSGYQLSLSTAAAAVLHTSGAAGAGVTAR